MTALLRLFGLLLVGILWAGAPALSQCLPLATLTNDIGDARLTPASMTASLPPGDWQLHQPATGTVYWTLTSPEPDPSLPSSVETRLELRRSNQQAQYDVVYKTARKACLNELRAELRRAKLKAEPVTCLQCEAERYTAPTYTVTIYNQQENYSQGKAPYPFVLVVHPVGGAPASN